MSINHVLFVCFLSALCGGNPGQSLNIYTIAEGDTGTINIHLARSGNMKFFCKDKCKADDILIKTDGISSLSGRYSIKYKNESSTRGILSVTITNATRSETGRYRCGLGTGSILESFSDFEVRVSDARWDGYSGVIHTYTEGENVTYPCAYTVYGKQKFLCKGECKKEEDILIETDQNRGQNGRYGIEYREGSLFGLYVTITQATTADTGWYKCGYGRALSPDSYRKQPIIIVDASTRPTPTQTVMSSSPPSNLHEVTAFTPPTTQPFISSSPPSSLHEATDQLTVPCHGYLWLLVVCVLSVGGSLLVITLLILYIWKKKRNSTLNISKFEFPVTYKELDQASTCEDLCRD